MLTGKPRWTFRTELCKDGLSSARVCCSNERSEGRWVMTATILSFFPSFPALPLIQLDVCQTARPRLSNLPFYSSLRLSHYNVRGAVLVLALFPRGGSLFPQGYLGVPAGGIFVPTWVYGCFPWCLQSGCSHLGVWTGGPRCFQRGGLMFQWEVWLFPRGCPGVP